LYIYIYIYIPKLFQFFENNNEINIELPPDNTNKNMQEELNAIGQKTISDYVKMTFFSKLKTNNIVLDMFLSTFLVSIITYNIQNISFKNISTINKHSIIEKLKSAFYRKYSITFEGRQSYVVNKYTQTPRISACFSDSFKAIYYDILKTMRNNNTVYDIQEYITYAEKRFSEKVDSDMFIIKQKSPILYNEPLQIYVITEIKKEESCIEKGSSTKIDNITITLYSYKSNISQIQDFVNIIKQNYLDQIENNRVGKKFIYTLKKIPKKDDDGNPELWNETIFESTRTFTNMFFEGKEDVLNKIQFFLNNKEWYYENGIPYTLGIGLYGPPGTGKTSFFKSLANLTGRHIVILSLKTIKTKQQLEETFFETRYNNENKINSIGFDKKIIIIEDIDCLGELVWKREKTIKKNNKKQSPNHNNNTQNAVNTVLNQIIENNTNNEKTDFIDLCKKSDDNITLDDILNLWDGIRETPGRILGISSNHYDKLDPALIRPGRIDISLHLNNCTRNMIKQMYKQYYKSDIDENILNSIKDGYFSPAEVINFYVLNRENPEKFLDCFIKNNKVRKS